jgi:hypothetical protein
MDVRIMDVRIMDVRIMDVRINGLWATLGHDALRL